MQGRKWEYRKKQKEKKEEEEREEERERAGSPYTHQRFINCCKVLSKCRNYAITMRSHLGSTREKTATIKEGIKPGCS